EDHRSRLYHQRRRDLPAGRPGEPLGGRGGPANLSRRIVQFELKVILPPSHPDHGTRTETPSQTLPKTDHDAVAAAGDQAAAVVETRVAGGPQPGPARESI